MILFWCKLAPLMADPTINEIQVQALGIDPTQLSVISEGRLGIQVHSELTMTADDLLQGLTLIASSGLGRNGVRGSKTIVHGVEQDVIISTNLDDGPKVSRLTAVVPPGSSSPCCAIRRFPVSIIPEQVMAGHVRMNADIHPYAQPGMPIAVADHPLPRLLQQAEHEASIVPWASCPYRPLAWLMSQFACSKNLAIYGATGSGKTTMLQTLISLTDHNERIISVEKDSNELFLPHANKLSLFCTSQDNDAKRTPKFILEAILRLTPEVIVYGELRGEEAFSFFDAVTSGHKGLTTAHAKNHRAAINRFISMAQRGAPIGTTSTDVRNLVLEACNILVQVCRQTFTIDNKVSKIRRVNAIHEVIVNDKGQIEYVPIFTTSKDKQGAPALTYTGNPGTLVSNLLEEHLPVPSWLADEFRAAAND
jgi:Flp pilus assembly CpaF family ATPase